MQSAFVIDRNPSNVFVNQDPRVIRRSFETSLAFFRSQRMQGASFNLNLELGTKVSFAEFLIGQGEILPAETQISEAREMATSKGAAYAITLEKCDRLTEIIKKNRRAM